ncbi:MAG: hypothetical protein CMJ78_06565 [Planctomycetaceae bacterium]|nr:hypothetical protein [Planctomycetaceae bacterium]
MDVASAADPETLEENQFGAPPVMIGGKTKSQILQQAIAETGGPHSEAIAKVKNHIDYAYPDFPWSTNWHSEISGAKAAVSRTNSTSEGTEQPASQAANSNLHWDPVQLQIAREFVDQVGDGCLERSEKAIVFMVSLSDESWGPLATHVRLWANLLNAVDGSEETADRVLAVLSGQSQDEWFPRLAPDTLPKVA